MPKSTTIAAAALLGLLAALGARAQGTGQSTTGQAQQPPGTQAPAPGTQGGGMMQQGMPMTQGQGGQGQGGMMMAGCPMMQRMASLDQRLRRLEERAGVPTPPQPAAQGAAPGSSPTR